MKLIWAIQKMTNQVQGVFYHKQFIKVYFDRSISQEAKAKVMLLTNSLPIFTYTKT